MQSHIDIQIKGKSLALPEDFSLDIEEKNPMFYDNEMFSYPVQMPLEGNREVVKNVDDVQADVRPVELEHEEVRIKVDGQPFKSGVAVMQEDEEVKDSLTMNIDASLMSFDDLVGDLECREVPLKDKIQVGEKIGNVRVKVKYEYNVKCHYREGKKDEWEEVPFNATNQSVQGEFEPQALGFSYPGVCNVWSKEKQDAVRKTVRKYNDGKEVIVPEVVESFINVSDAYPQKPYANARIAYTHYGKEEDAEKTASTIENISKFNGMYEDHWPFWCLEADRPQSGLCFYVLYFLECVFTHLGVSYDLSALEAIEDLKHLVFFTTHHKYSVKTEHTGTEYERYEADDEIPSDKHVGDIKYKGYYTEDDDIPEGSHVGDPKPVTKGFFYNETTTKHKQKVMSSGFPMFGFTQEQWVSLSNDEFNQILFSDINKWLTSRGCGGQMLINYPQAKSVQDFEYTKNGVKQTIVVGKYNLQSINIEATINFARVQADIQSMWATSENFPDVTVKEVLDALQNSFGVRWHYDYEKRHVTAYLYREVFRSQEKPIDFLGQVLTMNKVSEKITGVRMAYSAESEKKEQQQNVRQGIKDYDTDYDYIDYPADNTVIDKTYLQITKERQIENLTCYVDKKTGNAYRFKTSKEGLEAGEYHISLFEVAQFKGVEIGDCSPINEDFIKEFISGFQPVPFTDVNYRISEMMATQDGRIETNYKGNSYVIDKVNEQSKQTILAAFIDEEMEHEFIPQYIDNALASPFVDMYLTEKLELTESYNPSDTDDGNSPLQHYDWGMAIAVMRGGGSNMTVQPYDYNYDGFRNSRWRTVAGQYAMTSDTMDMYGADYDYNGVEPGIGSGERFSLKIRAYKPFRYKVINGVTYIKDENDPEVDSTWLIPCDNDIYDQQGNLVQKIRSRGLYDTFMSEYGYFLLNRKKFRITALCTAAQLADIANHWRRRYRINGVSGYIDKVKYNVSAKEGVNNIQIDFYAI